VLSNPPSTGRVCRPGGDEHGSCPRWGRRRRGYSGDCRPRTRPGDGRSGPQVWSAGAGRHDLVSGRADAVNDRGQGGDGLRAVTASVMQDHDGAGGRAATTRRAVTAAPAPHRPTGRRPSPVRPSRAQLGVHPGIAEAYGGRGHRAGWLVTPRPACHLAAGRPDHRHRADPGRPHDLAPVGRSPSPADARACRTSIRVRPWDKGSQPGRPRITADLC